MSQDEEGFRFFVEAPTKAPYSFTKGGQWVINRDFNPEFEGKSGKTDLTVINVDERINVEFKEGAVTPRAEQNTKNKYIKDFKKLFTEKTSGIWFHILETAGKNNNSLIKTLETIEEITVEQLVKSKNIGNNEIYEFLFA